MTLRYPSANDHAAEVETDGAGLRRDMAHDENPSGAKITPPPIEYLPVGTNRNLEDKLLALGRLDPELELEED